MIKGVNRQMIEILDTGSPYFERALLVVQAGIDTADSGALQKAAREMLQNADSCSHLKRGRRRALFERATLIFFSVCAGAVITLLLQWIM